MYQLEAHVREQNIEHGNAEEASMLDNEQRVIMGFPRFSSPKMLLELLLAPNMSTTTSRTGRTSMKERRMLFSRMVYLKTGRILNHFLNPTNLPLSISSSTPL
jgi:hypothetical protein